MEKLDINTLTEEQKKMIDLWYKFSIENGKLKTEEPIIFSVELIKIKTQEIKQKYQDIILGKYSFTDQANLQQEWLVIMWVKEFENREFTEEEKTRLMELYSMRAWITEQRNLCQKEIENLWN